MELLLPAWLRDAECGPNRRNIDPELFFPEQGQPVDPEVIDACAVCPVRAQCLEWGFEQERALVRQDRYGIWGGYTGRARTELAHGRSPQPVFSRRYLVTNKRKRDEAAA